MVGMDPHRHRTQKKINSSEPAAAPSSGTPVAATNAEVVSQLQAPGEHRFKNLLEAGAREAYSRPWHRIERGLRLNRIRIFIEEIGPQYQMTRDEKDELFIFLQKAVDNKLLNTLKVVQYDQESQRIQSIKGLELKRNAEGILKGGFNAKKSRPTDTTRKRRKADEIPSVSTLHGKQEEIKTTAEETKIEE